MNRKTTVITEPHKLKGMLSFIDVIAKMSSAGFNLGNTIKKTYREILNDNTDILEKRPELESLVCNSGQDVWHLRSGVSISRIMFDFYYPNTGSVCFIILSNRHLICNPEELRAFFSRIVLTAIL